jgi:sugar (pentulose or hexulose) kinase
MDKKPCYAVIDIGKTNKKVLIFDDSLQIVDRVSRQIGEVEKDGLPVEPVEEIISFVLDSLASFSSRYDIRVISPTTHGAMFVCLDREGNLAVPPVAYTAEPGEGFHEQFHGRFGAPPELKEQTATPSFSNLLNIAQGLEFVKTRWPEEFSKVADILMYPQYFTRVLTGNSTVDPTYPGSHSYLRDVHTGEWSSIVDGLGIRDMLPPSLSRPWESAGKILPELAERLGIDPECVVTPGVHDSNASLVPYLVKGTRFLLNSTGTWCVSMLPCESYEFRSEEMEQTVFYNTSIFNSPVKTAIFMGGFEYEQCVGMLGDFSPPPFDLDAYQAIVAEKKDFMVPPVKPGIGLFPGSRGRLELQGSEAGFADEAGGGAELARKDPERAYRLLNLSLALQSAYSFDILGGREGVDIYTEGGFTRNEDYNRLLAALYPQTSLYLTGLAEATSFGAAILARACHHQTGPETSSDLVELAAKRVEQPSITGLKEYAEAFYARTA